MHVYQQEEGYGHQNQQEANPTLLARDEPVLDQPLDPTGLGPGIRRWRVTRLPLFLNVGNRTSCRHGDPLDTRSVRLDPHRFHAALQGACVALFGLTRILPTLLDAKRSLWT